MIIALSGPMGSGKTTAVHALKFLLQDTNKKICIVKFAQPLYDMQEFIYRRIESAYARPDTFIKDRKLLQLLGADWGRETIDKDIWIQLWFKAAKAKLMEGHIVVCDDLRFDNEALALCTMGANIIKINAPNASVRITTANGLPNHSSEQGINDDYADLIIDNTGTLSEYQDKLIEYFKKILNLNSEAQ